MVRPVLAAALLRAALMFVDTFLVFDHKASSLSCYLPKVSDRKKKVGEEDEKTQTPFAVRVTSMMLLRGLLPPNRQDMRPSIE